MMFNHGFRSRRFKLLLSIGSTLYTGVEQKQGYTCRIDNENHVTLEINPILHCNRAHIIQIHNVE